MPPGFKAEDHGISSVQFATLIAFVTVKWDNNKRSGSEFITKSLFGFDNSEFQLYLKALSHYSIFDSAGELNAEAADLYKADGGPFWKEPSEGDPLARSKRVAKEYFNYVTGLLSNSPELAEAD